MAWEGCAIGAESSRAAKDLPGGLNQVGTCQKVQSIKFPKKETTKLPMAVCPS